MTSLRLRAHLVAVAAMLAATVVAPLTADAEPTPPAPSTPSGNAFYDPPSELPRRAGDLIRSAPAPFYAAPLAKSRARAWKVLYRSTNARGAATAVSGLVVVPRTPWPGPGPRPVVSFSHGTTGMGDRCAPSRALTMPFGDPSIGYEAPFVARLASEGWAVAVTDFEGLGTPGDHPYVVGRTLGRNALDVVRAAQRLPEAGLDPDAPVLIWGYSEGGNGAGWASQLAASYAPELRVKAAAIGGVPNDLRSMFPDHDGGPFAALIAMAAIGFDATYPELDLDSYLTPRGRVWLDRARDSCLGQAIPFGAFKRTADFTTGNPLETATWINRLEQNELANFAPPSFPIHLYQGVLDEAVYHDQALDLRRRWCARGARIDWRTVPAEHVTAYLLLATSAVRYLEDRLAGEAPPTNCP